MKTFFAEVRRRRLDTNSVTFIELEDQRINRDMFRNAITGVCAALVLLLAATSLAEQQPTLESGFHQLYGLDFDGAQKTFTAYQQLHREDPMGPGSEAAGVVFAELNRLGLLDSRVFMDDDAFRSLGAHRGDPKLYDQFLRAGSRTEILAQARLNRDPRDRDALLALSLISGLRADYAALIQDSKSTALGDIKQANNYAERLLAVCNDCDDAYVATGISEYLIGVRAAPLRWILRIGGYPGDKQRGIEHLRLAAQHGHLFAPFARLLLALAYLREKDPDDARSLLASLHSEYPSNALFARELQRLQATVGGQP